MIVTKYKHITTNQIVDSLLDCRRQMFQAVEMENYEFPFPVSISYGKDHKSEYFPCQGSQFSAVSDVQKTIELLGFNVTAIDMVRRISHTFDIKNPLTSDKEYYHLSVSVAGNDKKKVIYWDNGVIGLHCYKWNNGYNPFRSSSPDRVSHYLYGSPDEILEKSKKIKAFEVF